MLDATLGGVRDVLTGIGGACACRRACVMEATNASVKPTTELLRMESMDEIVIGEMRMRDRRAEAACP